MPEGLRERLAQAAQDEGRSLNREIVARLEQSFEPIQTRQGRGEHRMLAKHGRPAIAVGLVAAVAVLLAIVAGVSGGPTSALKSQKLGADPDRLISKNRMTPGLRGQGDPAPAATQLALEELGNKTYPASTLPFKWQKDAMGTWTEIRNRGADGGGSWQLAGPSTATYPSILNRTNADYVASGRVTSLAIAPTCTAGNCRLWVGAAGGGVWRTDDALASTPSWTNVSGSFGTSAIGALTYDAGSGTLYAGTGEPNSSADSDAGIGIYKSTDGGDSWTLLPGSADIAEGNSVGGIVVSGSSLLVATTHGVAGMAGVGGGAQPSTIRPDTPKPGLWKLNADGTSSLLFDDSTGAWGATSVQVDSHGTIYISSEGRGILRSADGGASWEQIFQASTPGNRTEFAINTVNPGGHTRIYIGDGGASSTTTGVYKADNIDTTPAATLLTGGTNGGYTKISTSATGSGWLVRNYCTAQCWYDNFVVSPAGHPEVVYVGGSYDYDFQPFGIDNGKAVVMSDDAGEHWYDQTRDAGDNGIHPDQHALVVNPANPRQFFEGSDGGVVRSSGSTTDMSGTRCPASLADLGSALFVTICQNANKAVPTRIDSLNTGLSTLQFQNIALNPASPTDLMGGTQDNGTWEGTAGNQSWPQTIYGDGGIAQFDTGNSSFRLNEFFSQYTDVNFQNGAPDKWVVVSGPFFASKEVSAFYKPQLADPVTSGTLFVGLQSLWRTQDFGGSQGDLEANCPEFTTPGDKAGCGDFVPLGDPSGHGGPNSPSDLTAAGPYGTDKTGGYVVAVARASSDTSTLWTATRRGRVFVSKNADAAAGSVSFTRIDAGSGLSASSSPTPRRFVSGIVVDPKNPNHAFVSFGGYNNATDGVTPAVPGHVFDVTFDPKSGKATWTSLDNGNGPLGDLPINALALDAKTNRLYVGTDFGVLVSVGKSGMWRPAAAGMPMVAISGLTLDSKNRVLYAATHGRAIWSLQLNGK